MHISPAIETYLKTCQSNPIVDSFANNSSVVVMRKALDASRKQLNSQLPAHYLTISDETIVTTYGPTPIRIYRPPVDTSCPVLILFHGGGFVLGNLDTLEGFCRHIASTAQCMVISVDYPLAPEHPFPQALECSYAATQWIYDHLDKWQGDQQRCFIGGSSAGATLALIVNMMRAERGKPLLAGQVLLCPMTDTDFETVSYRKFANGYNLTREMCIWFYSQYIPDRSLYTHPWVAPLRAKEVKNIPPTLMVTAECDPLRDEGRAYADKLLREGVYCQDLCYEGMIHGFYSLPIDLPETKQLLNVIKEFIQKQDLSKGRSQEPGARSQ